MKKAVQCVKRRWNVLLWVVSIFCLAAADAQPITTYHRSIENMVGDPEQIDSITHFPYFLYKKHEVAGVGQFYLDSRVDIIKNVLRAGNVWEPEIIALLEQHIKPGSSVLDIGAHIGAHTLTMSRLVGTAGKVYAFEPQKKLFTELVMNLDLNACVNVTAMRCAVGAEHGEVEMAPPVADNEGGTAIGAGGDSAPMMPIDALELDNLSLIKIDVENFEYQVLMGAEATIKRNLPYLIIEIMGNVYEPILDRQEKIQKTFHYLQALGYTLKYIEGSWSDWLAIPPSAPAECPSVAIFTYKVWGHPQWDPEAVKSGIHGSEESVIYVADQLATLGYQVTVFGDPPEGSAYSNADANPRYVAIGSDEESRFDIGISWRMVHAGKRLRQRCKAVYFWPHDTPGYSPSDEECCAFDDVLWQSRWQRQQWIAANPAFLRFEKIFGNGVNLEQFQTVEERKNPYSCIYSSNYGRGLSVLLDVWPKIKERYPEATLDVYYGRNHWGLLNTEQEEKLYQQLQQLVSLGVTERGCVSHEELNRAYAEASFWTYPCMAPETFCITGLRAQLAGAVPVIINSSALKETIVGGYRCQCADRFCDLLLQAMGDVSTISIEQRSHLGDHVKERYTWKKIAQQWNVLFEKDLR